MHEELIARLRAPWEEPDRSADHEVQRLYKLCNEAARALEAQSQEAKRVPLTKEQKQALWHATAETVPMCEHHLHYADALERAHGIAAMSAQPAAKGWE